MTSKCNLGGREEIRAQSTQRPLSEVYPCSESSHQRRWSADFNKPSVITVKKSKKEPKPPQRSTSLQRPHPEAHCSSKRYSCPVFGILSQPHTSFSSISSSPSAVQTSTITGPDPLGWKLRPKSGNASSQSQSARLSLQIPISDISTEVQSRQSLNSNNTCETKAPKLSRRHNSESLTFLQSIGTPLPVTSEELCAVNLRHMSDSDDVFCDGDLDQNEKPTKEPPPVPVKTEMARQIAQLIAELSIGTTSNTDEYSQD